MEGGSGTAQHARYIVEHGVGLGLVLEELDVGVEEVTLGDMDVAEEDGVDEGEDARRDGGLANGGEVGEGAGGGLVAKYDAVELGDIELVGGGAGGHVEGEAAAGENGAGDVEDGSLDGDLDRGSVAVGDLAAGGGEVEVGEGEGFGGGGGGLGLVVHAAEGGEDLRIRRQQLPETVGVGDPPRPGFFGARRRAGGARIRAAPLLLRHLGLNGG